MDDFLFFKYIFMFHFKGCPSAKLIFKGAFLKPTVYVYSIIIFKLLFPHSKVM